MPNRRANERRSCDQCRKRKCLCDRTKPCSNCAVRGLAHLCYVGDGRPSPMSTPSRMRTETPRVLPSSMERVDSTYFATTTTATESPSVCSTSMAPALADGHSYLSTRQTHFDNSERQGTGLVLTWEQISEDLPSRAICKRLLAFFLTEVRVGPVRRISAYPTSIRWSDRCIHDCRA